MTVIPEQSAGTTLPGVTAGAVIVSTKKAKTKQADLLHSSRLAQVSRSPRYQQSLIRLEIATPNPRSIPAQKRLTQNTQTLPLPSNLLPRVGTF
jgi:hypothetical protein